MIRFTHHQPKVQSLKPKAATFQLSAFSFQLLAKATKGSV